MTLHSLTSTHRHAWRAAAPFAVCAMFILTSSTSKAESWVVMQSRGPAYKSGASLEGSTVLTLKEGEKLTVINPSGVSVTLKGPYTGPVAPPSSAASSMDAKQALSTLVASREARSSAVGVIRAGGSVAKLPDPWLIDVTYPGARCLRESTPLVWWRPHSTEEAGFTLHPVDRSWSMHFTWAVGEDKIQAPAVSKFDGLNVFFIRHPDQEMAINLHSLPRSIDNPLVLVAWMLEKGCQQQADALLDQQMKLISKVEP